MPIIIDFLAPIFKVRTSVFKQLSLISVFSLVSFFSLALPAEAYVNGKISVGWLQNPPDDQVIGYRIYYGSSSRFESNGILKDDFDYEYYIDLSDSIRCEIIGNGISCDALSSDELFCENLEGSSPRCTLSNLSGTLHFSLTAYSASSESGFTSELKAIPDIPDITPPTPGPFFSLPIQILLLHQ